MGRARRRSARRRGRLSVSEFEGGRTLTMEESARVGGVDAARRAREGRSRGSGPSHRTNRRVAHHFRRAPRPRTPLNLRARLEVAHKPRRRDVRFDAGVDILRQKKINRFRLESSPSVRPDFSPLSYRKIWATYGLLVFALADDEKSSRAHRHMLRPGRGFARASSFSPWRSRRRGSVPPGSEGARARGSDRRRR